MKRSDTESLSKSKTGPWDTMEELDASSQEDAAMEEKPVAIASNQIMGSLSNNAKKVLIPLLPSSLTQGAHVPPIADGGDCVETKGDNGAGGTPSYKSKGLKALRSNAQPDDRLQRCRERNRIHARKTRLRKKEHMQTLQQRADELKQKQLRLKQLINEKNTVSILLGFATSKVDDQGVSVSEDPRVEALLRRAAEEIPDSTKIPELPALILPGQHASKKAKAESAALVKKVQDDLPTEGFDLELLAKDRSKCTPQELDQIRRERNRMHAKRTRDRKRLFMEEMGEICRQLEEENDVLVDHLKLLDPGFEDEDDTHNSTVSDMTPIAPGPVVTQSMDSKKRKADVSSSPGIAPAKRKKELPEGNQLQYLIEAACTFESASKPDHSTSSALFAVVSAISEAAAEKRRQRRPPFSSSPTAVGC